MIEKNSQPDPKIVKEADKQQLMGLIKAEREKRKLSQEDLAKMLDLSQGRVAQLESKQGSQKISYDVLLSTLDKLGYLYRIIPFTNETTERKKEAHLTIHGKLKNQIAGFFMENKEANQGGLLKVLVKGFFISSDPSFHKIADNIAKTFLFPSIKGLMQSNVASLGSFIIILSKDGKFDLHLGMPILFEGLAKRDFKVGEAVTYSEIASIRRIRFPTVSIPPDCGIIFHFSEAYRHGIYIDLTPLAEGSLDIDAFEREVGIYFQQLSYETHFRNDEVIAKMAEDGWFRFAAIPKEMFDQFYEFYAESSIKDKASMIRNHFSADRLSSMVQRWQKKQEFKKHHKFLNSALKAYKSGNYIATISTFYPRIEGVLRALFGHKNKDPNLPWLLKQLREAGSNKVGTQSLLFPRQFQKYLEEFLCKSFDFSSGEISFSRHSHAHGVADDEDYTQDRAIIGFLIMDQIYYYV